MIGIKSTTKSESLQVNAPQSLFLFISNGHHEIYLSTTSRPLNHMDVHPMPYIALSTSLLTLYQSALLSANSYTSSALKIP